MIFREVIYLRYTFPRGGIHPPTSKEATCAQAIDVLEAPKLLYLPLGQHLGAPSQPIVERGQHVLLGEKIAEAGGKISAPLHASVSGVVKEFTTISLPNGKRSLTVVLENDGEDTPAPPLPRPQGAPEGFSRDEIVELMLQAGLVGMGGATFPTHVKYRLGDVKVDTVILNGVECEPFLTCDHRLMVEESEDIILGLRLMIRASGAQRGIVGVEENKPDAIEVLREKLKPFPQLEVKPLAVKYPQGEERLLIKAALGRDVPLDVLPSAVGVVVNNVATAGALGRAFRTGMPLVDRVVSVTGPRVQRPGNWRVRIGTPVEELLTRAKWQGSASVLAGGPMTAPAIFDLKTPVTKGTSGLVAIDEEIREESPCIRCGKCIQACPYGRMPLYFASFLEQGRYDELEEMGLGDCRECGSCAYVCPAHRPILQTIKLAKAKLRNRG